MTGRRLGAVFDSSLQTALRLASAQANAPQLLLPFTVHTQHGPVYVGHLVRE